MINLRTGARSREAQARTAVSSDSSAVAPTRAFERLIAELASPITTLLPVRPLRGGRRDRDPDGAAPAGFALRPNLPAVRLDDAPGDIEPEAEAPAIVGPHLPEPLKDRCEHSLWTPRPVSVMANAI